MLFLINLLLAQKISLNNSEILEEYKDYCSPRYKMYPFNGKLKKLIVFSRHGDRSPLQKSKLWANENCVDCEGKFCKNVPCDVGMLTDKGYKQSINLGQFIKHNYFPVFDKEPLIHGYNTGYSRTISSLKGIINGMGDEKVEITKKPEINSCEGCSSLQKVVISKGITNERLTGDDILSFDKSICSICNDIQYDCGNKSCNVIEVGSFIGRNLLDYETRMKKIRDNINVNGVQFSYLARFIKEELSSKEEIILIAGHDSILGKVLNGLYININKIPSYSSAIFIEVWQTPTGEDVVRVNYDGKITNFGMYSEQKVLLDEFKKHISLFGDKFDQINNVCTKFNERIIPEASIISYIKDIFDPIRYLLSKKELTISALTENKSKLTRNPIKNKSNLIGLNSVGGISEPLLDRKSFGWFSNSDEVSQKEIDKYNTVKQKAEEQKKIDEKKAEEKKIKDRIDAEADERFKKEKANVDKKKKDSYEDSDKAVVKGDVNTKEEDEKKTKKAKKAKKKKEKKAKAKAKAKCLEKEEEANCVESKDCGRCHNTISNCELEQEDKIKKCSCDSPCDCEHSKQKKDPCLDNCDVCANDGLNELIISSIGNEDPCNKERSKKVPCNLDVTDCIKSSIKIKETCDEPTSIQPVKLPCDEPTSIPPIKIPCDEPSNREPALALPCGAPILPNNPPINLPCNTNQMFI